MASREGPYATKEFSAATWPDFERLFEKHGGVQAGCWCMFYHRTGPTGGPPSARRTEANRRDHRRLLSSGGAHGVIVYRGSMPVGWCQFGTREELPRIEHGRKYRALGHPPPDGPLWRITCFFVDRETRRQGIARAGLHAALDAIARRGGGLVEAYPTLRRGAVAEWFGSVSMFEREGFERVESFGRSNVLVRRRIPPRTT